MSQLIVNGDRYRIIVASYVPGQVGLNQYDYSVGNTSASPLYDTDVSLFFDQLAAPLYKLLMTSTATYYGVRVVRLNPRQSTAPATSNTIPGPGTLGGSPLPHQTCGLITKPSGGYGRGTSGRVYIPFPDEAGTLVAEPTAAYVADLQALATAMMGGPITVTAGISTARFTPAIATYHKAVTVPVPAPAYYTTVPMGAPRVSSGWATQRRRSFYGRLNKTPPW